MKILPPHEFLVLGTPRVHHWRGAREFLDGDTLKVMHHHHAERIRLSGIDCPETGQAYGKREKQVWRELYVA